MKLISSFYSLIIYAISAVISTVLWAIQWKAKIIRVNLSAFGLSPDNSAGFLFAWYFCLVRDVLRYLLGYLEVPTRIRPQDQLRLISLGSGASLLLTAHFHHWEALAAWLRKNGVDLLGSARALSSPRAQSFLEGLRRRAGVAVVSNQVLSAALKHLQGGRCFGVLWDQFSKQSRHSAPLFGIQAAMDPLPEVLVRRCAPVVFAGFLLPTGVFRLIQIHSAGKPLPFPSKLSRRYHQILETVVRAYPSYWYGLSHARLKDTLLYPGGRNVSRETSSIPKPFHANVSRET